MRGSKGLHPPATGVVLGPVSHKGRRPRGPDRAADGAVHAALPAPQLLPGGARPQPVVLAGAAEFLPVSDVVYLLTALKSATLRLLPVPGGGRRLGMIVRREPDDADAELRVAFGPVSQRLVESTISLAVDWRVRRYRYRISYYSANRDLQVMSAKHIGLARYGDISRSFWATSTAALSTICSRRFGTARAG